MLPLRGSGKIRGMIEEDSGNSCDPFGSTHWSVVLMAGHDQPEIAREALEQLCRRYWPPVHAYIRRRTSPAEDAQDLTQAFFAHTLDNRTMLKADPARGRFRAFLLTSLRHFLINEHAKQTARKRGGGVRILPLDENEARHSAQQPADERSPERLFEREWALTLLNVVIDRLCGEYQRSGKAELYESLKGFLTGQTEGATHADVARRFGMTEAASRAALARLRKRYRELLLEEVAQTVSSPGEVESELHSLFLAVSS